MLLPQQQRIKTAIMEKLDIDLIRQQAENGVLNFQGEQYSWKPLSFCFWRFLKKNCMDDKYLNFHFFIYFKSKLIMFQTTPTTWST